MSFFETETVTWEKKEEMDPDGAWKQAWSRAWLDEFVEENEKRLETIAQDPGHAVNDLYHALAAVRPKSRYLSGHLAKTVFYALWLMPEHWSFLIKKATISPGPKVDLPEK